MSGNVNTQGAEGGAGEGTDNDLIRSLRAQIKDLTAKVNEADPDAIREQVVAEVNREATAASLMDKAGFPKLGELFARDVEGDLTAESAASFLDGLGLTVQTPADGPKQEPPSEGATPAEIAAAVEQLANAAAAARVAEGGDSLDKLLEDANTNEDVLKAMRASGLTVHGH